MTRKSEENQWKLEGTIVKDLDKYFKGIQVCLCIIYLKWQTSEDGSYKQTGPWIV